MDTGWKPAAGLRPYRLWQPLPLVVDLDGGLLARDPVRDVLGWGLRHRPVAALAALWRHRRRPDLAARDLVLRYPAAQLSLRVNGAVLDLIAAHRRCGGGVTLVGAAPMEMVEGVARLLGLDVPGYGADRRARFTAARRALAAASLHGRRGFDFVGGGGGQAPLCFAARRALMVAGDPALSAALATAGGRMVQLPGHDWRRVRLSLGDLGAARGLSRGVRLLNRSLSAAIWDAAALSAGKPAESGLWHPAGPETGGAQHATPPAMQGRRGAGPEG